MSAAEPLCPLPSWVRRTVPANGSGRFLPSQLLRPSARSSHCAAPASSASPNSGERLLLCTVVLSWPQVTRGSDTCSWGPVCQFPSLHFLLEKYLLEKPRCLEVVYIHVGKGSKRVREERKKRTAEEALPLNLKGLDHGSDLGSDF